MSDLELDFAAWSLSALSTIVDFSVSVSLAEVLASLSTCELLAFNFDATAAEEFLSEEVVVVVVFSLLWLALIAAVSGAVIWSKKLKKRN